MQVNDDVISINNLVQDVDEVRHDLKHKTAAYMKPLTAIPTECKGGWGRGVPQSQINEPIFPSNHASKIRYLIYVIEENTL